MSTLDDDKLQEHDRRSYIQPLLVNYGSIADSTGRFRDGDELHGADAGSDPQVQ